MTGPQIRVNRQKTQEAQAREGEMTSADAASIISTQGSQTKSDLESAPQQEPERERREEPIILRHRNENMAPLPYLTPMAALQRPPPQDQQRLSPRPLTPPMQQMLPTQMQQQQQFSQNLPFPQQMPQQRSMTPPMQQMFPSQTPQQQFPQQQQQQQRSMTPPMQQQFLSSQQQQQPRPLTPDMQQQQFPQQQQRAMTPPMQQQQYLPQQRSLTPEMTQQMMATQMQQHQQQFQQQQPLSSSFFNDNVNPDRILVTRIKEKRYTPAGSGKVSVQEFQSQFSNVLGNTSSYSTTVQDVDETPLKELMSDDGRYMSYDDTNFQLPSSAFTKYMPYRSSPQPQQQPSNNSAPRSIPVNSPGAPVYQTVASF